MKQKPKAPEESNFLNDFDFDENFPDVPGGYTPTKQPQNLGIFGHDVSGVNGAAEGQAYFKMLQDKHNIGGLSGTRQSRLKADGFNGTQDVQDFWGSVLLPNKKAYSEPIGPSKPTGNSGGKRNRKKK